MRSNLLFAFTMFCFCMWIGSFVVFALEPSLSKLSATIGWQCACVCAAAIRDK